MILPKVGEEVSLEKLAEICFHYKFGKLWEKIITDKPKHPFRSDGCSLWVNSWMGRSLYPACFIHDIKYWAGKPGEDVERLIADAELMMDVAKILESTKMATMMFAGVRAGGHEMFGSKKFSWGYGRI